MKKYRIIAEQIEGEGREEFNENFLDRTDGGIICDGFVIMGDREDDFNTYIHDVNQQDIAMMIANNPKIAAAAIIAKAMMEARKVLHEGEISSKLASIFGK